jgi:hypothetical protein
MPHSVRRSGGEERRASLSWAVQFVLSYVTGANGHAKFAHSIVSFDHQQLAGEAYYQAGRWFEPKEARPEVEPAAFFEPRLLPLLEKRSGEQQPAISSLRIEQVFALSAVLTTIRQP